MKLIWIIFFLLFTSIGFTQAWDIDFYPFKDANGWSLKHANGERVLNEYYDSLILSNNNRIQVKRNDFWAIIDSTGNVLIPFQYHFLKLDAFGYFFYPQEKLPSNKHGFLSLQGDTLIPLVEHSLFTCGIANKTDFLFMAYDKYSNTAIYSSDGIQRTGFDYSEILEIDSTRFLKSSPHNSAFYFALETIDKGYGVYDALGKKIVVPPIYDDVCVSWCFLSYNPHIRSGPLIYMGKDPVFIMNKDDHPHVIRANGELFYQNDTISLSNSKNRYYLFENGETRLDTINCTEKKDDQPPYIFRNEQGDYLVDFEGNPIAKEKIYHEVITKVFDKEKERLYFEVTDQDSVGLMNEFGRMKIPQIYTSVELIESKDVNYFRAKKGKKQFDLYDMDLKIKGVIRNTTTPLKIDEEVDFIGLMSHWNIKSESDSNLIIKYKLLAINDYGRVIEKSTYSEPEQLLSVRYLDSLGHVLNVDEGENSDNYYLTYLSLTADFALYNIPSKTFKVFNNSFVFTRTEKGYRRGYSGFYTVENKTDHLFSCYDVNNDLIIQMEYQYTDYLKVSKTLIVRTDSGFAIFNKHTINDGITYYRKQPTAIGKKGMFAAQPLITEPLNIDNMRKVDIYATNGELILADAVLTYRTTQFRWPKCYAYANSEKEVWLTEDGIIYHTNLLP
ncbi:MAG: hypothetical protein ACI8ZM_001792 [Crocinitomix sp.]|jgi:hypothetical protein